MLGKPARYRSFAFFRRLSPFFKDPKSNLDPDLEFDRRTLHFRNAGVPPALLNFCDWLSPMLS